MELEMEGAVFHLADPTGREGPKYPRETVKSIFLQFSALVWQ